MIIERIKLFGLLAMFFIAAANASGQDFNERYAAWQGRAPVARRQVAPASMQEETVAPAEAPTPAPTAQSSRRILGDVAIVHARTTYTTADGRAAAGRYTDVWAKRNGAWLAVSAHVTRN